MKYVVGLTGGIASGKSVVSNIFSNNGVKVIDADVVSRFVMSDDSNCVDAVVNAFPSCVKNGNIDRKKLREIVFSSKDKLQLLNSITHPFIRNEIMRQIENSNGVILLVVPLLFETGYEKLCDYVVCVTCDIEMRIKRLLVRDNITEQLAIEMINSQMNETDRVSRSDYVIVNNTTVEELDKKVAELLQIIMENANKIS